MNQESYSQQEILKSEGCRETAHNLKEKLRILDPSPFFQVYWRIILGHQNNRNDTDWLKKSLDFHTERGIYLGYKEENIVFNEYMP